MKENTLHCTKLQKKVIASTVKMWPGLHGGQIWIRNTLFSVLFQFLFCRYLGQVRELETDTPSLLWHFILCSCVWLQGEFVENVEYLGFSLLQNRKHLSGRSSTQQWWHCVFLVSFGCPDVRGRTANMRKWRRRNFADEKSSQAGWSQKHDNPASILCPEYFFFVLGM